VDEKPKAAAILDGDDQFVSSGVIPDHGEKIEEDVD